MGVCIKGMEMPDKCGHCRFATAFECQVTKNFITTFNVRQQDCPLVPVPPHGRLGDLDAIEKQINYIANLQWNKDVGASGGMLAALDMVEDAQTIIPSSKEG